jgi:hypothetical protein
VQTLTDTLSCYRATTSSSLRTARAAPSQVGTAAQKAANHTEAMSDQAQHLQPMLRDMHARQCPVQPLHVPAIHRHLWCARSVGGDDGSAVHAGALPGGDARRLWVRRAQLRGLPRRPHQLLPVQGGAQPVVAATAMS